MMYIIKQEGFYQNKVNSSLVSTCNCKMGYSTTRCALNNRSFSLSRNRKLNWKPSSGRSQENEML